MYCLLLAQENAEPALRLVWDPLFEDYGLPMAIMGIMAVFAALVLVSTFIAYLPRAMDLLDRLFPPEEAAAKAPTPAAKPDKDEIDEEIVVVLAAAVAAVMDEPYRIIHTRSITAEQWGWSHEGRWQIHTSHKTH